MKKDKKAKNGEKGEKKKRRKRILVPAAILILILVVAFLLFGCDRVKQGLEENKAYTKISQTVKDKLPFDLPKLPEIPIDLPALTKKLPFDFPNPAALLGDKEPPDDEQILEDLKKYLEKEEKVKLNSLEIERRDTAEEGKEETVYAKAETTSKKGTIQKSYNLFYKKGLLGGWKLKEAVDSEQAEKEAKAAKKEKEAKEAKEAKAAKADKSGNGEKEEKSAAGEKSKEEEAPKGVDSKIVLADENLYQDLPSDWTYSNVKVIAHSLDMDSGTDRVIVYMELKTAYVNLTGTKEITYQLDHKTGEWKSTGPASKLACLSIEPIVIPGQENGANGLPV
ncbi:hypothetical protein [Anoxybacterium hadale]|uniref:hypothetical protein n=1 Tax=Anoxybacterium hadale TaxID=3408580 RepID=UPI003B00A922